MKKTVRLADNIVAKLQSEFSQCFLHCNVKCSLIVLVVILGGIKLHSQTNCNPPINPCEKITNGDFEQNTITGTVDGTMNMPYYYPTPSQICNWYSTGATPFTFTNSTGISVGLAMENSIGIPRVERITSATELQLDVNNTYVVSFDYLVGTTLAVQPGTTHPTIKLGLTNSIVNGDDGLPFGANLIAQTSSPSPDGYDTFLNVTSNNPATVTYPNGSIFNHFEVPFVYSGDGKKYLNITGTNAPYEFAPGLFSY